jgi:hypothetical protein
MLRYTTVIVVGVLLIVGLMLGGFFISISTGVRTQKQIDKAEGRNEKALMADFQTKDFPKVGVHLIGPWAPSFAKLAQLVKSDEISGTALPPVFLQNTSKHSVVGYRITWTCVDKARIADVRDKSNVMSYVFLHADESERIQAMAVDANVMEPNSTWFISLDGPTKRVQDAGAGQTEKWMPGSELERVSTHCVKLTISLDGLFFDDGTFLGPDTRGFFNEVESQMDARHEILSNVENDLKSGVRVEDIFRKLEQIAGQPEPELPELPSRGQYLNLFRRMFAKDILGMKNVYGTEKAIEDVHQQLSRPWVKLRKL